MPSEESLSRGLVGSHDCPLGTAPVGSMIAGIAGAVLRCQLAERMVGRQGSYHGAAHGSMQGFRGVITKAGSFEVRL